MPLDERPTPMHNLPTQATPFVGRKEELDALATLLATPDCRMLTLVGPGGIGKTRLALEAIRCPSALFADGTYFVALQPLNSPEFILTAIAEALRVHFIRGGDPKSQLLSYLQRKTMLLVIDNFEHLLNGVTLLSEVLDTAPGLKMLVTSRERLNLREEWVFELDGLSSPPNETESEIEGYSAVQFFIQAARRTSVGFHLSEANRRGVTRICQMVGGMPLALELAAGWIRVLSCEEIAEEIRHSLDILEAPARNMPSRHRNMRAVLDQSWKRLTEDERAVFRKLSVFRGGFTRQAAQMIAGAYLPVLASLVDKSLLRHGSGERYDLHELLRQYGEDQLRLSVDESEQVRDVHCRYFMEFMHQRETNLKGHGQLTALEEIETEFGNIRAGWAWGLSRKNYLTLNLAVACLFHFCEMRGRSQDVHELLWRAQEQLAAEPDHELRPIWGRMLVRAAWMVKLDQRSFEQLDAQVNESLAIARRCGDTAEIAFCLWHIGAFGFFTKDCARVIPLLEESLALYTDLSDRFYMARAADWLGSLQSMTGQFERFIQLSEQSLELRRAIGDRFGMAASLMNLAAGAIYAGQYDRAKGYVEEMGQIYQEIRSGGWKIRTGGNLAMIAFQQGDFPQAQALAEIAMEVCAAEGAASEDDRARVLTILGMLAVLEEDYVRCRRLCESARFDVGPPYLGPEEGLAIAACGLEDYPAARHYLLAVLAVTLISHDQRGMTTMMPVAAILLNHKAQHERAAEVLGLAFHHPASARVWMEQWALLTRLRAHLEAALGAAAYATAWKRGTDSDLEAVTAGLIDHFQTDEPWEAIRAANLGLIEPLSERELVVLRQISSGLSNADIADQLVVEVSTVKKHINHLYDKLGVHTRTQALVRARELNLL